MPSRLDQLVQETVNQPQSTSRLAGLAQRVQLFDQTAAAKRFDESLGMAEMTGHPLGVCETFLDEALADRDFWGVKIPGRRPGEITGPVDPTDPFASKERDPIDARMALGESIRRMDAIDVAKRVPFTTAGIFDSADLAISARRLQADKYDEEAVSILQRAESTEGKMLAGRKDRIRVLPNPQQLRDRDVQRIEAYIMDRMEREQRGLTYGAQVFEGASYLPAWMIEFSMTGGLNKLGSEGAKTWVTKALGSYTTTAAGRAALRLGGWTGGAITRTSLGMPHRIGEAILERRIGNIKVGEKGQFTIETPPESWATSIAKGWGYATIQTATETAGGEIFKPAAAAIKGGLAKMPFGSQFYDALRQAYLTIHPEPTAASQFVERFFTRAGYDGLIEEIGEERLATILTAITETQDFGLGPEAGPIERLQAGISQDLKPENLAVEATILALPAGAKLAAGASAQMSARTPLTGTSDAVQGQDEGPGQVVVAGPPAQEIGPEGQPSAQGGKPAGTGPAQPERGESTEGAPSDEPRATSDATAAQAAVVGPEFHSFEDYAGQLMGRDIQDIRKAARSIGAQANSDDPATAAMWVGAQMDNLLSEAEPEPILEGEPHPGSLDYKAFFARYGQALAEPGKPENVAWMARYGTQEGITGPRGLYRYLQQETQRVNAWNLFYELTGQERPASYESQVTSDQAQADFPEPQQESHDEIELDELAETQQAMGTYLGEQPPADVPPAPPTAPGAELPPERQPAPHELTFARHVLRFLGVRDPQGGFEWHSDKDVGRLWSAIQFPRDRAIQYPQYRPVRAVQVRRQRRHRVLVQALVDRAKPYLDLDARDQALVDQYLVAVDQDPGNAQLHGSIMTAFTPRQLAAANAIRRTLDDCAEMYVELMEQMGVRQEWIDEFRTRIGNYIPHAWYGDWIVIVRNKPREGSKDKPLTRYKAQGSRWFIAGEFDRLKKDFPDADIIGPFEATKIPAEAYQDAPYSAMQSMLDTILDRARAGVADNPALSADQKDAVMRAAAEWWKAKGFGSHFIQRQEVPGWTTDLRRPIVEYLNGFAGSITKMQAGLEFPEALRSIDPRRTPNLYARALEDVRYWMGEDQDWNRYMAFQYGWNLVGSIASATANTTQNLALGWPELAKRTRWSLAKLLLAMTDTATGRLRQVEKNYLAKKEAEGFLEARGTQEMALRAGNPAYRALSGKVDKAMSFLEFMQLAERFNRRSMYVALLRAGQANSQAEPGSDPADEIVNDAHFEYGKANRQPIFRGLLKPISLFQTWSMNYYTWVKNQVKEGNVGALARNFAALTAIAGVAGLPLVGELLKGVYPRVFRRDPEEDASELIGKLPAQVLFRGLPSLAGVSMTGSAGASELIPIPDPGQDWSDAITRWAGGITADVPTRIARVMQDLSVGNYGRALEDASPRAMSNILAARRLRTEGYTTRRGAPLIDTETQKQIQLTTAEAILKGMGFSIDRTNRIFDKQRIFRLVEGQRAMTKQWWADRWFLAIRTQDHEAIQEILAERQEYETAMRTRNRPAQVITLVELVKAVASRAEAANDLSTPEMTRFLEIYKPEKQK